MNDKKEKKEKKKKIKTLPIGERYLKVNFRQSLADLIIERWGPKVGKKLLCCFQDAIARGRTKAEVLQLLRECLTQEIEDGEITEEEINVVAVGAEHFGTLG